MIEELVPEALSGERADRVVAFVTGCTRSQAAALVAEGAVTVGGRRVKKGSVKLTTGDIIAVDTSLLSQPTAPEADPTIGLEVLYADDDVVVINKQAGLVVHPGGRYHRRDPRQCLVGPLPRTRRALR